MLDAVLVALVLAGLGSLAGAAALRSPRRRGLRLAGLAGVVLAAPFLLLGIAGVLRSDVLGWIAGLSMVVVLAAAVPLGAGLAVGALWSAWRRRRTPASVAAGEAPPTAGPRVEAPEAGDRHPRAPAAARDTGPPGSRRPTIPPPARGVLLAMAGVAAGFWVVIGVGFRLHDDPAPAAIEAGLVPAAAVLVATVVVGLRAAWARWRQAPANGARRRDAATAMPGSRADWLRALAADPRRRIYAERIARGDTFWTPERIAYDLDPEAVGSCVHLAPLEHALRADGTTVRWQGPGSLLADCVIDEAGLARRLGTAVPVEVEAVAVRERSLHEAPEMRLRCLRCAASIWVVHPDRATASTPRWPAITPVGGPGLDT